MAKELTIINPEYSGISFKSTAMNEAVAEIIRVNMTEALNRNDAELKRASAMCKMWSGEEYAKDGFKNMEEVGSKLFNYSKQQTYNYVNVGFAIKEGKLPTHDAEGRPFSFTALAHMLKIRDVENRTKLIDSGELSANQTIRELDEVVEENKPARKAVERKEKQVSIYCTEDDDEPTEVTTVSHFKEVYGEPFYEFKKDGKAYLVYLSDGVPTLYYYSTGKVIDTTGEVTPE